MNCVLDKVTLLLGMLLPLLFMLLVLLDNSLLSAPLQDKRKRKWWLG
jgi:hypothetical protein